jgi:hypothetical protein
MSYSSSEQIYSEASRIKPSILQCVKGLRKSGMGPRAGNSLRGSKFLSSVLADIIKSRIGPTSHIVCLRHTFSGQQSPGHQKGNITDGKNCEAAVPSLFRFEGLSRVQEVLFRGGKNYYESSDIILRLTL